MTRDFPAGTPATAHPAPVARPRPSAAFFALLILALALWAGYLVAVIAIRLDQVFIPGNELTLPAALKSVPGLSAAAAPENSTAVTPATDRITVLVLGLDRRPSEGSEPTRSDSIFVLTLDPISKTGGVLSIPRDLWLEIPDGRGGYFEDRINTAFRYGGLTNYRGGAMQAARDAVEHNFPLIQVDYEVVIDFTSFIKIIDSLGGVDVTVTEGFRYLEPVSVDGGGVIPEFRPGTERMTGERALYYSRFRDGPDGDLGRIARQQQVMTAAALKLLSTDALSRAPDLWSRYKDAVESDIPSYRIPGIALLARQVGLERVTMRSLGEVTRETVTAGGADVLVAEPEDLARIVGEVFFDARLRQENATVLVQNATNRVGLARHTSERLIQHGMLPSAVTISSTTPAGESDTVILNYTGKDYTAKRLAAWLGIPGSRVRTMRGLSLAAGAPDIVVVLGADAPTLTAGRASLP